MNKAFVPISLANPFYTTDSIRYIWTNYLKYYRRVLFVPCDTLRYLTYEGRGDSHPRKLVEQQLKDLTTLITSVALEFSPKNQLNDYEITPFSDIRRDARYKSLREKLRRVVARDEETRLVLRDFTEKWAMRVFDKKNRNILDIQHKYIVEETALSLHVTETLGFHDEYYRNGDLMFVNWLYENKEHYLKKALGKDRLHRKFHEIATRK